MKFTHDGTEYEVAELIRAVTNAATLTSKQNPSLRNRFLAASALLARHERVCEALERGVRRLEAIEWEGHHPDHGKVCPQCWYEPSEGHASDCLIALHIADANAALRGEEAKDV